MHQGLTTAVLIIFCLGPVSTIAAETETENEDVTETLIQENEPAETPAEIEVAPAPPPAAQSKVEADDSEVGNPLAPYSQRRGSWGALVSFGYSTYNPKDYVPEFVRGQLFSTYYDTADTPLIELAISVKKNFFLGSISADFAGGYYTNQGRDSATLSLTPVRVGGTYAVDTLFSEPYVVPYVSAGAYTVIYRETLASQAVYGRTVPAVYYAGGLRFQLDWVDESGDMSSYMDYGLDNTYLFIEARNFAAASAATPNLSNPTAEPVQFGGGLILEF